MELRKKILSHFLLASYLLVLLHQSAWHSHSLAFDKDSLPESFHKHEDFKPVHQEHYFNVGILHFLGHLFENINHSSDLADKHLVVVQKTLTKKVFDYNKAVDFYTNGNNLVVLSVDAESIPDPPPYHLFLFHRLKQLNTPLRAPPAIV